MNNLTFKLNVGEAMKTIKTFILLFLFLGLGCQKKSSNPKSDSLNPYEAISPQAIMGGYEIEEGHWMGLSTVEIVTVDRFTPPPVCNEAGCSGTPPPICSGTLISKDVILTAAHCAYDKLGMTVFFTTRAREKSIEINKTKDFSQLGRVADVAIHPDYDPVICETQLDSCHDLALLKLSKPAPAPYHAMPLLSSLSQLQRGDSVVLQGYGITGIKSQQNEYEGVGNLRATAVSVAGFANDKTYILTDQTQGTGFCVGDSGGPALRINQESKQLYLLGVISRTAEKASLQISEEPKDLTNLTKNSSMNPAPCREVGILVGIESYLPWIKKQLKAF